MFRRLATGLAAIVFVIGLAGITHGQSKITDYLSDAATKVKATDDASEKRVILEQSLDRMIKAMDKVQSSPIISAEDKAGLKLLKTNLQTKRDEMAGIDGFEPVPDALLDDFADYVVQDLEQADREIEISLVTLLLIIIIVILLV